MAVEELVLRRYAVGAEKASERCDCYATILRKYCMHGWRFLVEDHCFATAAEHALDPDTSRCA